MANILLTDEYDSDRVLINFQSLENGDIFMTYHNELCVKVANEAINAVNLENGEILHIGDTCSVRRYIGELRLSQADFDIYADQV